MSDIVPGEVFWYAVGRFYQWEDGSLQDFGYFVRLGGLPEPLFGGNPPAFDPAHAHFTFAAERFTATALPFDGDPGDTFSASMDPPGAFHLFYNPEPCANFDDVESFSRGVRIATFERIGSVVGGATAAWASNQFSARIVSSTPFQLRGKRYDLREMLGKGITQVGAAGPSFVPQVKGAKGARSFVGSAVRI